MRNRGLYVPAAMAAFFAALIALTLTYAAGGATSGGLTQRASQTTELPLDAATVGQVVGLDASVDGKTLIFESRRAGKNAVWAVRGDGTGLQQITPWSSDYSLFGVTPSGEFAVAQDFSRRSAWVRFRVSDGAKVSIRSGDVWLARDGTALNANIRVGRYQRIAPNGQTSLMHISPAGFDLRHANGGFHAGDTFGDVPVAPLAWCGQRHINDANSNLWIGRTDLSLKTAALRETNVIPNNGFGSCVVSQNGAGMSYAYSEHTGSGERETVVTMYAGRTHRHPAGPYTGEVSSEAPLGRFALTPPRFGCSNPDAFSRLIVIYDGLTGATRRVHPGSTGVAYCGPRYWSPDNARFTVGTVGQGRASLEIINANNGGVRSVRVAGASLIAALGWIPGSDRVAFYASHGTTTDLYAVRQDGTGLTQLSSSIFQPKQGLSDGQMGTQLAIALTQDEVWIADASGVVYSTPTSSFGTVPLNPSG